MIDNILIITWKTDWDQCCESLIPSISKNIEYSNVKLVIDDRVHLPETSPPSFENIKLDVIYASQLLERNLHHSDPGHLIQQLCKLAGYKIFNKEFVAIDSEIEILRPINTWKFYERNRDTYFKNFVDSVNDRFQIKNTDHYPLLPQTPYTLNPKILRKIVSEFGSFDRLFDWFIQQDNPSEFILYDIYKYRKYPQIEGDRKKGIQIQHIFKYPYTLDPDSYDIATVDRHAWKENKSSNLKT
jgi:hypothetical protein